MRLDKYLKVSRLIKRRTVANEACDNGRISVNGALATLAQLSELGETWIDFHGPGEPQKLFDGAYHGGISDDGRLAVTGARLLRARIAKAGANTYTDARDTVWYNGEQACNASLSKDGSKRTAFLDFASATGREFVGESYAVHERLLVMDSTGALVASVAAPSGYSFDHAEWVQGRSDLAVATITNAQGAHSKIVLVKMENYIR